MDDSLWQDEAELANVFLEEDLNRRSSGSSSPAYHFTSTQTLKRNLTSAFDQELPTMPVSSDRILPTRQPKEFQGPFGEKPEDSSLMRPPLPGGFPVRPRPKKSKKNFSVYLRIRPLSPNPTSKEKGTSTIEIVKPDSKNPTFPTTIRTYPPNISNTFKNNSAYAKEFNFDSVIGPETNQEFVYSTVAAPMIKELLEEPSQQSTSKRSHHKSALLFSYGITNAGKTHTILGDMKSANQADWGIIPRTINDVFQQKPTCNLYISFFEVYNENVFDLMPTPSKSPKYVNYSPPALKIRECRGQIFVRGLAKHRISTIAQGIDLTKQAHKKRHTSSNNLNSDSSRSHFICQIQIVPPVQIVAKPTLADNLSGYSTDEEATARSRQSASTIWIVDLAGSERSKRTRAGGTRQKESNKINNSLVTLMRCLNAMKKDGKKGHGRTVVPFRESKLTHIFMGHLASESAARTAMMVNVNPSVEDFDETQHVLAYSRKAKLIEIDLKEYGMKRKEFFGDEYDENGRKKPRLGETKNPPGRVVENKSKATLMSRIAQKLSPKKYETEKSNGLISNNVDRSEEIEKLEKSLQAANEKVASLENQNLQLLDELDRKEDEIRAEVSMEMESRLRETRQRHNEKYERLKSQLQNQEPKDDISVSMSRAGTQIEELMDKVDECEKEILRMTKNHQQTVSALHDQIDQLNRKQTIAAKESANDKRKISSLEDALKKSNEAAQTKTIQEVSNKLELNENTVPKDTNAVKSAKCKRNLRPRKPLGNSTNYASRVFAIDGDY